MSNTAERSPFTSSFFIFSAAVFVALSSAPAAAQDDSLQKVIDGGVLRVGGA
jgi:hypothetical protein